MAGTSPAALGVGGIVVQLPARWICACSTSRSHEVARDLATSLGLP
jgi:hypothetical protein